MHLRYNYRIEPSEEQQIALARLFGCVRKVWNIALAARKDAWKDNKRRIGAAELSKMLTQIKKTDEFAYLAEVSCVPLQQSLRDLETAYQNFFASVSGTRKGPKMGLPVYKSKHDCRQSARFTKNSRFKILKNGKLRLPGMGEIKVRWSRDLPSEPSTVTIIREPNGKYYASFVVIAPDVEPLGELDWDATETGIDIGLSTYAVLRGRTIASPKFFRRAERKLAKAQRELSRKRKGSKNRQKAKLKLAAIHAEVRNQRTDFIGKETSRIIRENQAVYTEDPSITGWARTHGKSVADQSLGAFLRTLEDKCTRYGRYFARVGRFVPSTQTCSACWSIEGPKGIEGLGIRSWTCSCGAVHDRDENAEKVIRAVGRTERLNACGVGGRPGEEIPNLAACGEAGTSGNPRGITTPSVA